MQVAFNDERKPDVLSMLVFEKLWWQALVPD